jgi:phenylacetate-coenzyme A ligase PaaK-like adenylate-forming protein
MKLEQIFQLLPYSLKRDEKRSIMVDHINCLNTHHSKSCEPYKRIQRAYGVYGKEYKNIEDFLYIPVSLFKDFDLRTINDNEIIKVLTSSGTTSSKVSRIFLDKETSWYQTKALSVIMKDFVGAKRLPMIIVDSQNVIKDRKLFSARGAGILGMSNFGRDHLYLLDDDAKFKMEKLAAYLDKYRNEKIIIFGFTYLIWLYLYNQLVKNDVQLTLQNAILIHSGGWKRLSELQVDNVTFKKSLSDAFGLTRIHNFYGMVEQVGSVFMECDFGYFHSPVFSEVVIRNPDDWSVMENGKEGVVEALSILPHSYPGHVLLTEDLGVVYGEDDCRCGRMGKYFGITGRIPQAEIRGCSDTYEEDNG